MKVDLLVIFNIFLNINYEKAYGLTSVQFNDVIFFKKSLCFSSFEVSADIFQLHFEKLIVINNKFLVWINEIGRMEEINSSIRREIGYEDYQNCTSIWLNDHQDQLGISSEFIDQMTVKK